MPSDTNTNTTRAPVVPIGRHPRVFPVGAEARHGITEFLTCHRHADSPSPTGIPAPE